MPVIKNSQLEKKMRTEYANLPIPSGCSKIPTLKWPKAIEVTENQGRIILNIKKESIIKNMQDNESAFEGWILVLKSLIYQNNKFSITFPQIDSNDEGYLHYQRFLFRLSVFDSLYGKESHDPWFDLSQAMRDYLDSDCRYINEKKLISNIGKGNQRKNVGVNNTKCLSNLIESEIEKRLCKDGTDNNCLKSKFKTEAIYRQFPVGLFRNAVSQNNALFPGKKACVDLVADGKDQKSFWIFELKKKGNIPLGIISELLFYTAVVRDMIARRIETQKPLDRHCYDSTNLVGKNIINACFLAPEFHPLLIEPVIDRLNNGFNQLSKRDDKCSVVFHKAIIDMDGTKKLFIR